MNPQSQILSFLETHEKATIKEISQGLGLTIADIRYHIKYMLTEGKIELHAQPYQKGAGRPACQYHVKTVPNPDLLLVLMDSMLKSIEKLNPTRIEMQNIADEIVDHILGKISASGSRSIRLTGVIQHLVSFGFDIRWEAHRSGPNIIIVKEPISLFIHDPNLSKLILKRLIVKIKE